MACVAKLGMPWNLWVVVMAAANMMPVLFLGALEAQVILGVFAVSALSMMTLFHKLGFVRLLGMAHVLWLFLVPWLLWRVGDLPSGGLATVVWAVIVINGTSLIFDIADVIRYVRGEREPTVAVSR
jgi:hypothetical protein